MKEESREYVMQTLATMVVQDRAAAENRSFEEVLREFRRSKTFGKLFDESTGLWMNGPDYISEEYDLELQKADIRRLKPDQ